MIHQVTDVFIGEVAGILMRGTRVFPIAEVTTLPVVATSWVFVFCVVSRRAIAEIATIAYNAGIIPDTV